MEKLSVITEVRYNRGCLYKYLEDDVVPEMLARVDSQTNSNTELTHEL
jgi:hypothetical protein